MLRLAKYARSDKSGAIAVAMIVTCLVAGGCAGRRFHHATNLAPEYLMPPVENVKTIDLSRLATQTVSNELIDRGDVLQVSIETGYDSDKTSQMLVRVGDDGLANVPVVGKVPVAGLELEGAEQAIAAAAVQRSVFRNPIVTVLMKRQRVNKVMVLGAVDAPGAYELPRGSSSLLSALVAAGGLSDEAGVAVEIRRPAASRGLQSPAIDRVTAAGFNAQQAPAVPVSYHVDLVAATKQDHVSHELQDGDVVMVHRRDPQPFDVIGLVTKPGRFELPPNKDLYLLDALAMAGGVTTHWADRVHLVRQVPGQDEPVVIKISLKEAKHEGKGNLRLGPGDIVTVEATSATMFTNAMHSIAPYSLTLLVPFIR